MTPEQKQWWDDRFAIAEREAVHWSVYDWPKARWPNFGAREMACNGTDLVYVDPDFMDKLQALRKMAGTPLEVTSGYRSPARNKEVGGAARSMHMLGIAADISIPGGLSGFALRAMARRVGLRGTKLYTSWLHVDDRLWDWHA